jgi:DNA-binding response OmpR family regulator
MLTTSSNPTDKSRARKLGVYYLIKPFSQEDLLKIIPQCGESSPVEDFYKD